MRFYISDLHFYHKALLTKMDARGFASVEEMHAHMIEAWNQTVRPQDEVVILGDLSMEKGDLTNQIVDQLNGRLYLIVGNHDSLFLKDRAFHADRFVWIKEYEEMKDDGRKVVLSHYPIVCYNGQYRLNKEGIATTYMLYGHVHDTRDEKLLRQFRELAKQETFTDFTGEEHHVPCQMINCFCMKSDYHPLTLDQWIELEQTGTYTPLKRKR